MKRRLRRFRVTSNTSSNSGLTIKVEFNDGHIEEAVVRQLSIQSVNAICSAKTQNYLDTAARAKIIVNKEELYDVGRVFVLKAQPTDNNQAEIILRTLNQNIPLEKLMKFLDNSSNNSPYEFELNHGKFTLLNFYNYNGSDDILEKTDLFHTMQKSWKKKHVYQFERFRKDSQGKRVRLDQCRSNGNDEYLVFGSNDYLGLANHPKVIQKAKQALDMYGFGSTGSPLTTGQSSEHIELQNLLTEIFHKESCLLFNSGYATNVGMLSAICKKNDLILYDSQCHASILDGLKMAAEGGAHCVPFRHNDMDDLDQKLKKERKNYSGCLIVTEGIFSMDGDIADMRNIVQLAKKHYARTYLDVAHDFGVIGDRGLGAAEFHGVLDEIDIIMGTFSKIAGGIGGFCLGEASTIEYIRYMSRAYMFSVALPPSTVAAVKESVKIFWQEREHLLKLKENIKYFVEGLIRLGVQINYDHKSSICPVIVGDEDKLNEMTKILFDNGIYVTPIVFPAVKRNECRFRFTVSAQHDKTDLDHALLVLKLAMNHTSPALKLIS
ncbi:MAG: aminotransferase class I/II-fold pyridoxal phosphate-dependent enzyme [Bdellovibrionota bacterium]